MSLAGISVLAVLAAGCGGNGSPRQPATMPDATETAGMPQETEEESAVTFTDDLGREVTVDSPERVAALIGSFADIWILAGGEITATVNDAWVSFDLGLGEDVVNLGSILEPDVEQLIASRPDFVIASANTDADLALEETLTQAGCTVAYFDVADFDGYLHMLEICTAITGRNDLYEQNGIAVQEQIEHQKERIDGRKPTVLFLRASLSGVKAKGSEGNVCGEILADLDCVNVADQEGSLLDELSMEAVIAADPEYIFVTIQGNDSDAVIQNVEELLISHPAWSSLSAVQNGHYYLLDRKLFNLKPNAKWGEAYQQMADILYPDKETAPADAAGGE